MSEFSKGVIVALLFIAGLCLILNGGMGIGKEIVADDCANYGAFKIRDKFYECKMK